MKALEIITSAAGEAVRFVDDHKETFLLIGAGALGALTVGATVRATLKCSSVIQQHKENMAMISYAGEISDEYNGSKDQKDDVIKAYATTALGIAKEVALPTVLAAGTVACVVGEHCIMQNKVEKLTETVIGLSAAYTAIDTAFKKYRKNVIAELGEEADDRFRYGVKKEKIEVTETNEKGKTKTVTKEVEKIDDDLSGYASFFDCKSKDFAWKDPLQNLPDWDANETFLKIQRSIANNKLRREGYLFLNDVYDMLGLPRTKAGQVVGWIYNPEDETIDNEIDFGVYKLRNKKVINREEGYQYEQCILLDFNVDGPILEKLPMAAM